MRNLSINGKIVVLFMTTSALTLLFALILYVSYDIWKYEEQIKNQLEITAQIIGENNSAAILFEDKIAAKMSIKSLQATEDIVFAQIINNTGKQIALYQRDSYMIRGNEFVNFENRTVGLIKSNNYIDLYHDVNFDQEIVGLVHIRSDLRVYYEKVYDYIKMATAIFLISLFLTFLISTRLRKVISDPLLHLAGETAKISAKNDYSIRIKEDRTDEIGTLIEAYNNMLKVIETRNSELITAKEIAINSVKSKDRFFANMSHEIRTPMNAIIGMSKLLNEAILTDKERSYLDIISISSANLLVIINDILDFSKMESGEMSFENIGFKGSIAIDTVCASLEVKANEQGVILESEIQDELKELILLGDPIRLQQILLNLVSNAIKFTSNGGVKIIGEIIEKSKGMVSVKFEIEDTGCGISPENLENIFRSFKQADSKTFRLFGGTGLGLSISKNLVELQGGKIYASSVENVGSTFSFELSYRIGNEMDLDQNMNLEVVKETNLLIGKSILVVEDNEYNKILATEVLKAFEVIIHTADNGKEALETLKSEKIDLVLMDMQMPVMDGVEATYIIRNEMKEQLGNIPIIALTANAFIGIDKECKEAGMDDYISKPFDHDILFNKMARLLRGNNNVLESEVNSIELNPKNMERKKHSYVNFKKLRMMTRDNTPVFLKMLKKLEEVTPSNLEEINNYMADDNLAKVAQVAHRMKPAMSSFGNEELDSIVLFLEECDKEEREINFITEQVEELNDVVEYAFKELQDEILWFDNLENSKV
ncbi:MAG: response regulator [Flavobacteriales bacterium]|nr:response regulator [Flavobacteriales bacterium]